MQPDTFETLADFACRQADGSNLECVRRPKEALVATNPRERPCLRGIQQ